MRALAVLVVLVVAAACVDDGGPHDEPLRDLAAGRLRVGAAVNLFPLTNESIYADVLAREFDMVVAENAMKMDAIQPAAGEFDFARGDGIVSFAREHGMAVRGHTLVWHRQLPDWVMSRTRTRQELLEVLRTHIETTVAHYRGEVVAWDVVNEVIADDGGLRDSIWLRVIGPDFIDLAFRWAHEADPDALLFLNEYGAEGLSGKSDEVLELVRSLREDGVPVHGVGLQMHQYSSTAVRTDHLRSNISRLADLGVEVHITELDVAVPTAPTGPELVRQAQVYSDVTSVCVAEPACTALVFWGFTDRHTWIPEHSGTPGFGRPLLFDERYEPKRTRRAVADALASRPRDAAS